ncbi:hypothetical protein SCHPADRAFT_941492 [Schizopora paradoxa]|uniref:DUF6533 domain-containing protein n=1 Tax=Schizopora paradoxa TaxID=27342 RepID=A0A0H2RKD7_9AGAM|nr:hypothetical protein SCHPADRAFT_941492 [Schizopora paradoxa]
MSSESADEIVVSAQQLISTKTFLCASVFLLLYDHVLTISDEIDFVWKRRITPVTCLFLLNRYYAPLVYIVLMVAEFTPLLTPELILTLRVSALYSQSKFVLAYLLLLLFVQLAVGLWTLSRPGSGPLPLPPVDLDAFTGCFYVSAPNLTKISTGCLWIEIAFDLSVFGLTLARTLRAVADDEALGLVRTVFRDGILYFLVIFSTNLVWALMVIFAPVGLKYINAEPSVILVVIMINRLTLNLRSRLVPSSAITSSYAQNSSPIWTFARFRRPVDDSHHGVLTDTISIPNTGDFEGETTGDIYMDNLAKKTPYPSPGYVGHRHPDEQDESEDVELGSSRGQDTSK